MISTAIASVGMGSALSGVAISSVAFSKINDSGTKALTEDLTEQNMRNSTLGMAVNAQDIVVKNQTVELEMNSEMIVEQENRLSTGHMCTFRGSIAYLSSLPTLPSSTSTYAAVSFSYGLGVTWQSDVLYNSQCYSMDDGKTWTEGNANFGGIRVQIVFQDYLSIFSAVAVSGDMAYTSMDGLVWTAGVAPALGDISSQVSFYSKTFDTIYTKGGLFTSTDGVVFTATDNAGPQPMTRFTESSTCLLGVSTADGNVYATTDNMNFQKSNLTNPDAIVYNTILKRFIAFKDREIYMSENGIIWTLSDNVVPVDFVVCNAIWNEAFSSVVLTIESRDMAFTFDGSLWLSSDLSSAFFSTAHTGIISTPSSLVCSSGISGQAVGNLSVSFFNS